MKKQALVLWVMVSALCPVYGFQLLEEGYSLQSYAHYSSPTSSGRMALDDSGNLYISHYDDGKIIKINPDRQSSTLATGLGNLYDLTWGGGSVYGNYLYVTCPTSDGLNDKIYRVDTSGNAVFAPMTLPNQQPCGIGVDKHGNYNYQLYTGTSAKDRIVSVSTTGTVSTFSTWPGQYGGGVYGLSFDPSGKYDHKMFLANIYDNASLSGLFMMNPNGAVSRFATGLVSALNVDFDHTGLYFDHDMFVIGRAALNNPWSLWRVGIDGSCQEFMRDIGAFTFGDDGAMYVSQYGWGTQEVSISRVIPEPATLLLLAIGGVFLRRRKA